MREKIVERDKPLTPPPKSPPPPSKTALTTSYNLHQRHSSAPPPGRVNKSALSPSKVVDDDHPLSLSFRVAVSPESSSFKDKPESFPISSQDRGGPLAIQKDHVIVPISDEDYSALSKPWNMAIICKVVRKSFSREFLKIQLVKLWSLPENIDLIAVGRGFYVVVCPSYQKRASILADGRWVIQGAHIWVQCWEPGFRPSQAKCSKGVVWVNLPELPLKFYKQEILVKLGRTMGEVVKIDARTLEGGNKRFARLCLLMEGAIKPPSGAWLGKSFQPLEFMEGQWFCESCNVSGHSGNSCRNNRAPEVAKGGKLPENPEATWVPSGYKKKVNTKEMITERGKSKIRGKSHNSRWTPKKTKEKETGERVEEIEGGVGQREMSHPRKHVAAEVNNDENPFTLLQNLSEDFMGNTIPPLLPKRGVQGTATLLPRNPDGSSSSVCLSQSPKNSSKQSETQTHPNPKPQKISNTSPAEKNYELSHGDRSILPTTSITILKPTLSRITPSSPPHKADSPNKIFYPSPPPQTGNFSTIRGLHASGGSRGNNRNIIVRSETNDPRPQECGPTVQGAVNVHLRCGVLSRSPSPNSKYKPSSPYGSDIPKVANEERGRSRQRRT
ncbi:uncharacterized protein LOC125497831 [Beta vulgaris subsp. vulgaris]|uniref:uncharacterized protein LOC125497831 n=1 Tax=Beta vulgaris subsp. vulgaris TaxID=3555 RepID=UPI002036B6CC|nr:uncharacterized protein LOC125497831 [Beta vulgaris subsp. vulgaris]